MQPCPGTTAPSRALLQRRRLRTQGTVFERCVHRGMFGHSGWCATLEDWFDPRRVREHYFPTGFKPFGANTYAVKGHLFGLDLSEDDRKSSIVFLRTL